MQQWNSKNAKAESRPVAVSNFHVFYKCIHCFCGTQQQQYTLRCPLWICYKITRLIPRKAYFHLIHCKITCLLKTGMSNCLSREFFFKKHDWFGICALARPRAHFVRYQEAAQTQSYTSNTVGRLLYYRRGCLPSSWFGQCPQFTIGELK